MLRRVILQKRDPVPIRRYAKRVLIRASLTTISIEASASLIFLNRFPGPVVKTAAIRAPGYPRLEIRVIGQGAYLPGLQVHDLNAGRRAFNTGRPCGKSNPAAIRGQRGKKVPPLSVNRTLAPVPEIQVPNISMIRARFKSGK